MGKSDICIVAYVHLGLITNAAAFAVLILAAGYLGLAPNQIPSYAQSDKVLHFVTFFLLTVRELQDPALALMRHSAVTRSEA